VPGALTAALNWYRAATREDVGGIGPVTSPVLYVWSDQDASIGRDAAASCGSYVEGPFRFEVLEGIDHWIPEHAPDRLNALLLDHLASPFGRDKGGISPRARPKGVGDGRHVRCRPCNH
jgi:pimeloyl-ACP methyl ester carboxylesterase